MAGGRIKGITIEIGGDTTKLESALKSVNTEIKNTESKLKDVNKLLKMDPGNTELLSQKYKTLQQEIQATKEKLNTLKEAAKQAEQALKDGTISQDQYDALQREIAETEQSLKSLEQEYKNFGSVQAQQIAAAGEKMKEFGAKVEDAGKPLTTHVTLPLAAVGAAGVASFAEVDKTMQLTNKTMGNTEEQAQLLNQAMKEAAANSTFGMKDAAQATLNFARAGLDAEQAAAALAPAMNLAAGEGGNLDTVSGGLVATINGFHGSFEEAGHYADVFAAACNNSALDVDSLSGTMSVAAPIFSAAGSAPVASYHFDESGYPVKTDTIFSFPEGPTFPSGWEWYLYKKSYRAFATGGTTPSPDVPLGYALYGASTGDSVRVYVHTKRNGGQDNSRST